MTIRFAMMLGMLMFSVPTMAQEEQPLILMRAKIPGLFDTNNPGPYNVIYDRLIEGYGPRYTLREAPLRRAITAFVKGDVDCFFFATGDVNIYHDRGVPEGSVLISSPVNSVSLKLFSREGTPVINDISSLKGSYVAVDQGATEISRAADHLSLSTDKLLPAQTLAQAFLLLNQKRVDAVLAFDSDVAIYQKNSADAKTYGVSESLSLGASQDSVICKRSARTEVFIAHINQKLAELRASGALQTILAAK